MPAMQNLQPASVPSTSAPVDLLATRTTSGGTVELLICGLTLRKNPKTGILYAEIHCLEQQPDVSSGLLTRTFRLQSECAAAAHRLFQEFGAGIWLATQTVLTFGEKRDIIITSLISRSKNLRVLLSDKE